MSAQKVRVLVRPFAAALLGVLALVTAGLVASPASATPGTGSISGTITVEDASSPAGMCAQVYTLAIASAGTDCTIGADGAYQVDGLLPGDYLVTYYGISRLVGQWYLGASSYVTATHVTVTSGGTAVADVQLLVKGTVSGDVTLAGGGAATGGTVSLVDPSLCCTTQVSIDGAGHYSFADVYPGNYYVRFNSVPWGVDEWYLNATGSAGATTVAVVHNANTTVDAELASAGRIGGNVTLSSGGAAASGWVDIYDASDTWVNEYSVWGGVYQIDSLPAGNYRLQFTGFAGAKNQYYDQVMRLADATPVAVVAGVLTSQDIVLAVPLVFSDTSGNAFEAEIQWMSDWGISTGYGDGTYRPVANVSRQAMAAFMYRLAGSPAFTPPVTSPFNDVATDSPFYAEVTWMADQGISAGYPDGGFHPLANVSRQAMAAFMYRFAGSPAFTPPVTSPFNDVATDASFYAEITWVASNSISTGYADGGFHPAANVSRQAMSAFMFRLDGVLHP